MPEDKLVTIATYNSYIEAELAKGKLDDAGIKAMVLGENARNMYAGLEAIEEVELKVMEPDAEQAAKVLADQPEKE